ncbi:BTAD domain-containing putative transcriptional regulator [Quadrisphaera sp. KR29]|uniref:BTAD domain-containing putative transcriptional regulator n=1 Tax=Quadrisphaera sp. KR29 TaxID=3461391 RepID=UPI0040450430
MSVTAPSPPTGKPSAEHRRHSAASHRAPATGRRRPVRRAGDVLRGLGAAGALVTLLAGPPVLLWQLAPVLVPTSIPDAGDFVAALTTPDDGTLFLRALALVAGGAWLSFAGAVALEALAALRGWRLPLLPLLGVQQRIAGGLVAAVAVLFVAPAAVAAPPVMTAAAAPPPSPATSPESRETPQTPPLTVQVAVHRGDTLWGIAAHHLGDGALYPELVDATRDVIQPDGRHLQDADQIYPGWIVVVPSGSPVTTPRPPGAEAGAEGSTETPGASASPARDEVQKPDVGSVGPVAPPAQVLNTATSPSPRSVTTEQGVAAGDSGDDAVDDAAATDLWALGMGVALSGLTAAGIAGLIRRRRQRQQRHRRQGQRLPTAPPSAQTVQRQVHAAQDPLSVAQLDEVLRALSGRCHRDGSDLPDVRSIRLTGGRIELQLVAPARPTPPFTATDENDSLWHLDRHVALDTPGPGSDDPTPFPTLVVLGRDLDGGLVLVDLEAVGELCVASARGGSADEVEAVLSAIVVDLATSPWGAEADVVVTGSLSGLVTTLGVPHVEHTDDVDGLLAQVERWADDLHRAVTLVPQARPAAGRASGDCGDALRPRVLVIGSTLRADQSARLARLTTGSTFLPLAVVSTSAITTTAWTLAVEENPELALLQPLGLRLSPQYLSGEARQVLATAVRTATDMNPSPPQLPAEASDVMSAGDEAQERLITPAPVGSSADSAAPVAQTSHDEASSVDRVAPLEDVTAEDVGTSRTAEDCSDRTTAPPPRVLVLGPVEVQGPRPGSAPSNNLSTMTELVALLALYPNSQPHLVDGLLWPGERVPRTRRNQLISRTRAWLGSDADGARYLPLATSEGYQLAPAVRSDWDDFRDLVGDDPPSVATGRLVEALELVRGQPFAGVHPYRYAWADVPKQSMIELIVDVAVEVAERALGDGDAALARRAAAIGLQAEPGSEQLWRAAMRAEHLAGNRRALEALAQRFTGLAEELGDDLEEETHELISRLLPRTARDHDDLSEGSRHVSS